MIVIIDFGSQTTHLIKKRLQTLGFAVKSISHKGALEYLREHLPLGIILSGGPSSVLEENAPQIDKQVIELGIPVLGICYGWQLIAKILGAQVKNTANEYGPEVLNCKSNNKIFADISESFTVWMSHGDTVVSLPKDFEIIASTQKVKFAGAANFKKKIFGIQFHPEVNHSEYGTVILQNFVSNICKAVSRKEKINPNEMIQSIKETVGNHKVICAVSGGVDSTVAAFLIGKAIGKNLISVYVDNGLMKDGTQENVKAIFTKVINSQLVIVKAKKRFLDALKNKEDPEEKRQIIGKLYVDIFQEEAIKHKGVKFLGQGTIYSDVIESKGSKEASKIKSHHNVGGLPKEMSLKLLEPLRDYYKNEVREIGQMVGLPEEFIMTQPFPGPGYAIRIRGKVTQERLEKVKAADKIISDELYNHNLHTHVFQGFAVMTGAYSTAVKGDARAFDEVIALRIYESKDIMTATWAKIPYQVLQKISSRIVNEVPHISRVVYDITTKPPATMEWE
ncbi:MAG: glutamine-hydrolyzing GMP synthase [Rickettsiales bacterium]|nr:glutamine-hydrolyzing GMP synthase [Rickettsiales bacterium]